MKDFIENEGIKYQFSAPYTPQQNGVVERKNRTLIEMARTMLNEFKSSHNFGPKPSQLLVMHLTGSFSARSTTRPLMSSSRRTSLTSHTFKYSVVSVSLKTRKKGFLNLSLEL
jgi:transposase InsO family protein